MKMKCTLKEFWQRVLYKISGQKILSFFISSVVVIFLVLVSHFFTNIKESVVLRSLYVVRDLALGLMVIKGVQNISGILRGDNDKK